MKFSDSFTYIWVILLASLDVFSCFDSSDVVYTNTWAVEISGGPEIARDIAERNGFHYHGPLGSLDDHYLFEHKDVNKRSRRSADNHHAKLFEHVKVIYAKQQEVLSRKRRGFLNDPLFGIQWYLKNTGIYISIKLYLLFCWFARLLPYKELSSCDNVLTPYHYSDKRSSKRRSSHHLARKCNIFRAFGKYIRIFVIVVAKGPENPLSLP